MKLIVNDNFQYRGFRRAGTVLTVPDAILEEEIKKGRKKTKKQGRYPWISGLLEHCSPVNQETADFIEKSSGHAIDPVVDKSDEEDDSAEIKEIWAEFESLGKACDKRWKLPRLRNELAKVKKMIGEEKEQTVRTETVKEE